MTDYSRLVYSTEGGAQRACPTCGTEVEWTPANRFRPFCSERCKNVDLGAWASGSYAIPEEVPSESEGDDVGDEMRSEMRSLKLPPQ